MQCSVCKVRYDTENWCQCPYKDLKFWSRAEDLLAKDALSLSELSWLASWRRVMARDQLSPDLTVHDKYIRRHRNAEDAEKSRRQIQQRSARRHAKRIERLGGIEAAMQRERKRHREARHGIVEPVELPVPVVALSADASSASHLLRDEIDRIAEASIARAPWSWNRPTSRRYEGYR